MHDIRTESQPEQKRLLTFCSVLFLVFGLATFIINVIVSSDPSERERIEKDIPLVKYLDKLTLAGLVLSGVTAVWHAKQSILDNQNRMLKESLEVNKGLASLYEQAGAQLEILEPAKIDKFRGFFDGAKEISAYNPPLDLLRHESRHRDYFYNLLTSQRVNYRIIAGTQAFERLRAIKSSWENEHGISLSPTRGKLHAEQVQVIYHDHVKDLHSEVRQFIDDEKDLRGLSFFLVSYSNGDHAALLYLLGMPFGSTFEVPSFAIQIKTICNLPGDDIYTVLNNAFEKRWRTLLHSRGSKNIAEI